MYELASILGSGSIVRLFNDGTDNDLHSAGDGHVVSVEGSRVRVKFRGWIETWQASDLVYDGTTGVWRAKRPAAHTRIIAKRQTP
jgi:hypothetical protein